MVERPHQRELFVVGSTRVNPDRRARGAASKQYHGASPAHAIYGLLPHLRTAGRIHRDLGPSAVGQPAEMPGHVRDGGPVDTRPQAHAPDLLESPAGLADDDHLSPALPGGEGQETTQ